MSARQRPRPWVWFLAGMFFVHLVALHVMILRGVPLWPVVIQAAAVGVLQTLMIVAGRTKT